MKYLVPVLTLIIAGIALHACASGQGGPGMLAGLCMVCVFAALGWAAREV